MNGAQIHKKTFGHMVKIWRIGAGLHQENLAEMVDVSRVTISNIETATCAPNICLALDIVRALRIPYSEAFAQIENYEKTVFNIDSLDVTPRLE